MKINSVRYQKNIKYKYTTKAQILDFGAKREISGFLKVAKRKIIVSRLAEL